MSTMHGYDTSMLVENLKTILQMYCMINVIQISWYFSVW